MSLFEHSPWPRARLGDLCADKDWATPAANPEVPFEYVDIASVCNQRFEVLNPKSLLGRDAPSRARKRIRRGDVLVATTRPYLRSIARVPAELDDQVCSTGFCVLRPKAGVISDWIFFAVLGDDFIEQLTAKMRGANYPAVADSDVLDAVIPLPEVAEQRRIVSRIKACMERVEEIEGDTSVMSREIDAVFPAILGERFTEIFAAYGSQPLEDVADIRGGSSLPKGTATDQGGESVLLVKVGDMNIDGNDRVMSVAREFLAKGEAGRSVIPEGAVIMPKRGGAIATNKKRMLGRPALIDPNLMAVVARHDLLSAEFIYYWSLTLDLATLSRRHPSVEPQGPRTPASADSAVGRPAANRRVAEALRDLLRAAPHGVRFGAS